MAAYYNEIDPKAAAWLRGLIRDDLIAPGDVDERSIEDVHPDDLRPYTQSHFFAGIGVWSYALRRAGWPDDRRVWTGSCPCQPLSQAGKGRGFADERHLWPAWEHLVRVCRPPIVFGEQVASKAADSWADLVQDDVEALGYAFGAVPFPAASVGAPHIRDRLYWLADDYDAGRQQYAQRDGAAERGLETRALGYDAGRRGELGDASSARGWRDAGAVPSAQGGAERRLRGKLDFLEPAGGVGDHHHSGLEGRSLSAGRRSRECTPWATSDFVWCRDGKWRPVEPGTFPLAHGAPERVGRLRGYGNAIVAEAAKVWIETYLESAA